jgi:hypothetical protein
MTPIPKNDFRYKILKTIPMPQYIKKVAMSYVYLKVNLGATLLLETCDDNVMLQKITTDPKVSTHHTTKYKTLSIHSRSQAFGNDTFLGKI